MTATMPTREGDRSMLTTAPPITVTGMELTFRRDMPGFRAAKHFVVEPLAGKGTGFSRTCAAPTPCTCRGAGPSRTSPFWSPRPGSSGAAMRSGSTRPWSKSSSCPDQRMRLSWRSCIRESPFPSRRRICTHPSSSTVGPGSLISWYLRRPRRRSDGVSGRRSLLIATQPPQLVRLGSRAHPHPRSRTADLHR